MERTTEAEGPSRRGDHRNTQEINSFIYFSFLRSLGLTHIPFHQSGAKITVLAHPGKEGRRTRQCTQETNIPFSYIFPSLSLSLSLSIGLSHSSFHQAGAKITGVENPEKQKQTTRQN